ncbi:hypothetical protein D3C75_1075990 [compost metagenome]
MATVLLASAVPDRVGVLSLVLPPLATLPVTGPTLSSAPTIVGARATVSTTSENDGERRLSFPAGSVALRVRV